ncbi:hypothetical protein RHMOL_Rhmol06G0193400 [Rhododendron molle]|uniref:Uncharacterized protein n=1 Tax=Rhododendron molle TaxID=49168 RepID=A0ACC0NFL5_RHOML|nr:hypothetical protein RHMOL_Rhmol06G0193400 [Rhododendron molle]
MLLNLLLGFWYNTPLPSHRRDQLPPPPSAGPRLSYVLCMSPWLPAPKFVPSVTLFTLGMVTPTFHIAMYPWFALGHLTPFLHLSNKLAKKGHKISFLIPTKTQKKLQPFNLHPELITFVPIAVPPVPGLPPGVETTADVGMASHTLLMEAMDRTED